MPKRKLKFLLEQAKRRAHLHRRIERLTEKELELYTNNRAIKRYVSIQHLRDHYRNQLRDIGHSIDAIVGALVDADVEGTNEDNRTDHRYAEFDDEG